MREREREKVLGLKYNLKNRPKRINPNEDKFEVYDDIEVKEWFEGFEAELREKLERNWKAINQCGECCDSAIFILEGVLGE